MTTFSIRDAAREAGVSKTSILRAIQSGRMSAPRKDDGGYAIDPAELFRVFPPKGINAGQGDRSGDADRGQTVPSNTEATDNLSTRFAALEAEVQALKELVRRLDLDKLDLKSDRDAWKNQAESAQRLLTTSKEAQKERPSRPGGPGVDPLDAAGAAESNGLVWPSLRRITTQKHETRPLGAGHMPAGAGGAHLWRDRSSPKSRPLVKLKVLTFGDRDVRPVITGCPFRRVSDPEGAVLAVVSAEHVRHGRCTLVLDHIAALAGVCRKTVKNALREAQRLALVRIEERRLSAWRNAPNAVTRKSGCRLTRVRSDFV